MSWKRRECDGNESDDAVVEDELLGDAREDEFFDDEDHANLLDDEDDAELETEQATYERNNQEFSMNSNNDEQEFSDDHAGADDKLLLDDENSNGDVEINLDEEGISNDEGCDQEVQANCSEMLDTQVPDEEYEEFTEQPSLEQESSLGNRIAAAYSTSSDITVSNSPQNMQNRSGGKQEFRPRNPVNRYRGPRPENLAAVPSLMSLQIRPASTRPVQTRPVQIRPTLTRPTQMRPNHMRAPHVIPAQIRPVLHNQALMRPLNNVQLFNNMTYINAEQSHFNTPSSSLFRQQILPHNLRSRQPFPQIAPIRHTDHNQTVRHLLPTMCFNSSPSGAVPQIFFEGQKQVHLFPSNMHDNQHQNSQNPASIQTRPQRHMTAPKVLPSTIRPEPMLVRSLSHSGTLNQDQLSTNNTIPVSKKAQAPRAASVMNNNIPQARDTNYTQEPIRRRGLLATPTQSSESLNIEYFHGHKNKDESVKANAERKRKSTDTLDIAAKKQLPDSDYERKIALQMEQRERIRRAKELKRMALAKAASKSSDTSSDYAWGQQDKKSYIESPILSQESKDKLYQTQTMRRQASGHEMDLLQNKVIPSSYNQSRETDLDQSDRRPRLLPQARTANWNNEGDISDMNGNREISSRVGSKPNLGSGCSIPMRLLEDRHAQVQSTLMHSKSNTSLRGHGQTHIQFHNNNGQVAQTHSQHLTTSTWQQPQNGYQHNSLSHDNLPRDEFTNGVIGPDVKTKQHPLDMLNETAEQSVRALARGDGLRGNGKQSFGAAKATHQPDQQAHLHMSTEVFNGNWNQQNTETLNQRFSQKPLVSRHINANVRTQATGMQNKAKVAVKNARVVLANNQRKLELANNITKTFVSKNGNSPVVNQGKMYVETKAKIGTKTCCQITGLDKSTPISEIRRCAEAVGPVDKCGRLKRQLDVVVITFFNEEHAVKFRRQYTQSLMNGQRVQVEFIKSKSNSKKL